MANKNRKRIVRYTTIRYFGGSQPKKKYVQDFNEADFYTRKDFLKDLKAYRRAGVPVKVHYGRKPYVPYKDR